MRLFRGWGVVAASAVSLSTNPGQFAYGALGLFMLPLITEFGWSRTEVSLALTVFTGTLALSTPFLGRLVDQYGAQRVLFPSVMIFGVLLLAIPLTVSKLWHLWLMFILIGSLAAGANTLPYLRILGAWFDRRRGMAFGLAMAGGGLGYAYVPPMLQGIIGQWGWRAGYVALGVIVLSVSAPIVWFLLRDTPQELGLQTDGGAVARSGYQGTEAVPFPATPARGVFALMWGIFTVVTLCMYGLLAHLVPMLVDRGMQPSAAAWSASVLGSAILISRAVVGYVIDHWFAPRVAGVCFALSAVGLAWFAFGIGDGFPVVMAICLVGLSIGAELDLLAYLSTRYFGVQRFGAVYGLLFAGFMVGTAAGPVVFAAIFDRNGNYTHALATAAVLTLGCALATLALPDYKDYSRD